jgi:hypothetical protein
MNAPVRYGIQAVLYGAFAAFVGYFSTAPTYDHLAPGEALVRLSFSHAAQRKEPCRERTPEELAKLAPNMRAKQVCPRARSPVTVEIELDGRPLYHIVAPPAGLAADGASTVYRRLVVPAGRHEIRARLSDNAQGEFNYVAERTIELAAGRVLLIDFNASAGGFVFRM